MTGLEPTTLEDHQQHPDYGPEPLAGQSLYTAAAKLREFGCNNVADQVEKHADELTQQVALAGLGGLESWATRRLTPRGPNVTSALGMPGLGSELSQEIAQHGAVTGIPELNLWGLKARDRGLAFEEKMGMSNLPDNFTGFDHFDPETGLALSLKSLDTTAPSYQTAAAIFNRLKEGIDNAANHAGDRYHPDVMPPSAIKDRLVYVITNANKALTTGQINGMVRAEEYAHNHGVVLLFGSSTG
ncbi:hypothetical protein [Kitasatospora sp. NPDC088346]|uniref:endonuclease toxin domain-containing protein n=1 Tax=Kitasatospora sp. NPDC088346 TaxID=3364073 RepID=UPI0038130947